MFFQVGDFGLSRIKKNTFLSSRSTVGSVITFLLIILEETTWKPISDEPKNSHEILDLHFKKSSTPRDQCKVEREKIQMKWMNGQDFMGVFRLT